MHGTKRYPLPQIKWNEISYVPNYKIKSNITINLAASCDKITKSYRLIIIPRNME